MPDEADRAMRRRLRQDAVRQRRYQRSKFGYTPVTWFLDPAWICIWLHRLSHRAMLRGRGKTARLLMQLNSLVTGADIQPGSDLGGGLLIPTPAGITLSTKTGDNLTVLALAGIGGNILDKDVGAGMGLPLVGRNVTVGQYTGIQGSIVLGDDIVFTPGSGVLVDIPSGARMVLQLQPQPGAPPDPPPPRPVDPACGHAAWRQTRADWRADADRYLAEMIRFGQTSPKRMSAILTNPLLALLVHRIAHWLACNGWRRLAGALSQVNILLHKVTIPASACLGGGVLMPHLSGTVFHGRAGTNLSIFANALCTCTGNAAVTALQQAPSLGDSVTIAGHGGVFGPVHLGCRVQVGPKSQVAVDVGEDHQVYDPNARGTIHGEIPQPAAARAMPSHALPQDRPWRETWQRMREDKRRLNGAPGFPGLLCVRLFRLSHGLYATGWLRAARWCAMANTYLTGADISPASQIAGGLFIPHPAGVALHGRAGRDLTVMATAGFGALLAGDGLVPLDAAPQLGDGVHISHHSGVYGAATIGHGVTVMPGLIVINDVPDGQTLVPRALRIRNRVSIERARARASALRSQAPG